MGIEWRQDAPHNFVELVVGRCLQSVMDAGKWHELGLLTDTADAVKSHGRLLRSLYFGDDDYDACVLEMVPVILGTPKTPAPSQFPAPPLPDAPPPPLSLHEKYPNLNAVTEYLDLPAWAVENNPQMFDRLFVATPEVGDATMPDGTVLSAAEAAAARLEVGEMRRQVDRIRRDHAEDPEAAVGQAKELIETVCKTILGLTGDAPETKDDVPKLVARTLSHLGLDPSQVSDEDVLGARAAKRVLGGVSSILNGAAELRNARGTGHGRSGTPMVDGALARLAVSSVMAAVVYLLEAYEAQTRGAGPAPELVRPAGSSHPATAVPLPAPFAPLEPPRASASALQVNSIVEHATYGEGQVTALAGEGRNLVANVLFAGDVGEKRLLVLYANLRCAPEPTYTPGRDPVTTVGGNSYRQVRHRRREWGHAVLYRLTPPAGLEWTDFPGHGDLFDTVLEHGADLDRLEWQLPEERAFSADLLRIALRHGHRSGRGLVVSAMHLVDLGRADKLRVLAHEADLRSADLRQQNGALMEALMPGWTESGIDLDARVLASTERSAKESEADLAKVLAAPVNAELAAHWASLGGSLPD